MSGTTTTSTTHLWENLTNALNALDEAGLDLMFLDRRGPETDWWAAPYVCSGNRPDEPRAAWNRKQQRWVVEQR
ncbi:hypothetical protein AB0I84_07405 [Streptomyces spectabilis]|uniref:hypothetical protein n=1 Tax=Streptomyces spectabilis TaxID=68270 RepID=UPI0033E41CE7